MATITKQTMSRMEIGKTLGKLNYLKIMFDINKELYKDEGTYDQISNTMRESLEESIETVKRLVYEVNLID